MRQLNGVVLDAETLHPSDLDLRPILDLSNIAWQNYAGTTPQQVSERIARADIILTNKVVLTREHIEAAQNLKYIGVLATGMNVVSLDAVRAQGITVTNISNYGTPSVVQHTFALILALTTKLADYALRAVDGHWSKNSQFCLLDFPVRELNGLSLGIIGYGNLGRSVAAVGRAFGMEVIVAQVPGWQSNGDRPTRLPFDDFLAKADIVSVHCPLADNTRHLIGARELRLMKSSALFINCARGDIIDEFALATALKNGAIAGAGLDVLSQEPPPRDHVLLDPNIPNLVITPHCAWGAQESRQRLVDRAAEHLKTWLQSQ
jgi:glycerate dehydrogenase